MKPLIRGIHHAAIKYDGTEQFKEALHFYHDLLGLPILRTWGKDGSAAAMLDTGNGILELFAACDTPGPGTFAHVALATDDVELCINTARLSGYEIIREPFHFSFPVQPAYHAHIAFCKGPGGEILEFFNEE